MTTGFRNSSGVDFDDVFDPYVQGTKPAATGYRTSDGVDLNQRFAPLSFGTAAAVQGYRISGGADVNTLWAAKGTASYALPINGNTYTSAYNIPTSSSGYALIGFRIVTGNTWQVYSMPNGAPATILASGAIPAGAATVAYAWGTYTIGVGQSDAGGGTTNGAASPTAVASNPDAHYQTGTNTATSGSRDRRYPFTIDFFNASAANISHTAITLIGDTEGSV